MKIFFYSILASVLYFAVLVFGVKPACAWILYQPKVPNIK